MAMGMDVIRATATSFAAISALGVITDLIRFINDFDRW